MSKTLKCKHCGKRKNAERGFYLRLSKSMCKKCRIERSRKWEAENREAYLQHRANYNAKSKEYRREFYKDYYKKHQKKLIKAQNRRQKANGYKDQKAYYLRNREKALAYAKYYYRLTKERKANAIQTA